MATTTKGKKTAAKKPAAKKSTTKKLAAKKPTAKSKDDKKPVTGKKKSMFNKPSQAKLKTCDDKIVLVLEEAAKHSPAPFEVTEGGISLDVLRDRFNNDLTTINPDKFMISKKDKVVLDRKVFKKAKNLIDGKMKKSRMVTIITDSPELVAGHILGTASRKKVKLSWRGSMDMATSNRRAKFQFELV